jgi:hypothetical protein
MEKTMDRIRTPLVAGFSLITAFAVGFGFAVHGQQRKPTLTPQDYMEIQQLVAKYPYTLDGGLDHGKALADLFTDDGEFHQQTGRVWKGRQELMTIANKSQETPNALGHFIMNHWIEPTPDGAIGKEYLITVSAFGDEKDGRRASTVTPYHYEDVYAKTPAGWRFKSRTVVERDPNTGRGNGRRSGTPSTPQQ